jgi:FlaA1/EpsC-like NDP-sugar epimerase
MIDRVPSPVIRYRLPIIVVLHALFAALALTMSFLVRFDFSLGPDRYVRLFLLSLPINVMLFVGTSAFFNLFQGIWRYVSVDDLRDIVKAALVAGLVFAVSMMADRRHFAGYPRSIYAMNIVFFILLNGGTRFAIRTFREAFAPMSPDVRNVIIVGAGNAGNEVAKALKSPRRREYIPVGFVDRDPTKHGKRLQGLKILGDDSSLPHWIRKYHVRDVFIAVPEITNKHVQNIVQLARIPDWEVRFKIVPSVLDIMSGKLQVNQLRPVQIDDLLARPNIKLDDTHVRKEIAGRTVLITGAGGSIGSEIAMQVSAYLPARLLLLDAAEEHAYQIDRDIKARHPGVAVHTVVASVLDTVVLDMLMRRYPVDFVFHAAAYKHVHLMEWNPITCIKNNVLGTATLALASERHGVKQFVMISTDKAVNPRGIMGASKRLAERVALERNPSSTKFNVVRFGNVLGSSGSVIPLFQRQIRDGGPVTVTHPEARRFFMSIPEAVQLVLQAASLEESKAIFLLEMGEPVKIVDLAANLIELSGLRVGEDIEIVFTGMRPGEKIEEELLTAQENLIATQFDKIRLQRNSNYDPEQVEAYVHELRSDVDLGNEKAIYDGMRRMMPEMAGPSWDEFRRNLFA